GRGKRRSTAHKGYFNGRKPGSLLPGSRIKAVSGIRDRYVALFGGCAAFKQAGRLLLVQPFLAPMLALQEPGHLGADDDTEEKCSKQPQEQRRLIGQGRIARIERIDRELHRRAIGNRQRNQNHGERYKNDDGDDAFCRHSVYQTAPFRRSRSSLPVLKKGTHFSSTSTVSPVRGLRPLRAGRFFTEKAPKPRSSTRLPSARAFVISSNTAPTMFSTSR